MIKVFNFLWQNNTSFGKTLFKSMKNFPKNDKNQINKSNAFN